LGWLIIANGLAASLSAPLLGKLADQNSRNVMAVAALLAVTVGVVTWYVVSYHADWPRAASSVAVFFLVSLLHGAVRLGRKVYLVDMADNQNRARYVAVSNTVVGIAMLLGGMVGVLADMIDVQAVILILSLIALAAGGYIFSLKDISG